MPIQILSPFQKLGYSSFYCWILIVLYIFWMLDPNQLFDMQIFSLIQWVAFSLPWECTLMHKTFFFFLILIFNVFHPSPTPLPSSKHLFVFYIYESGFGWFDLFCYSYSTCKGDSSAFVFVWHISLSKIPPNFIHSVANGMISLFLRMRNIETK